jgi:hypothetical protein
VSLCDRCSDRRVAAITGYPELPDAPQPIQVADGDGRLHLLEYRVWRAPTGIEVELGEAGFAEGYHFAVLGAHDGNVSELVALVTHRAEEEIARRYLEPNPHRAGWIITGDEAAGRLVCGEEREFGGPYDVVVDGHTLTWEELGRALEPYEGWHFRLVLEDRCEDVRPDAEVIELVRPEDVQDPGKGEPEEPPNIDTVLLEFLAEQEQRLAPRTYRNYAEVASLLRHCLNSYGHQSLDDAERSRFDDAYDSDDEAFVHLFGPEKITDNLGEFLGYFMIRKVMAGEELLRAAGTVTKKLAKWLGERGYLDPHGVDIAVDRGSAALRDLPKAEKLSRLLHEQACRTSINVHELSDDDYIEDYLMIERVEPGAIFFDGGVGPVTVTTAASDIAEAGWSVSIVLGRVGKSWQVIGVGNVYP